MRRIGWWAWRARIRYFTAEGAIGHPIIWIATPSSSMGRDLMWRWRGDSLMGAYMLCYRGKVVERVPTTSPLPSPLHQGEGARGFVRGVLCFARGRGSQFLLQKSEICPWECCAGVGERRVDATGRRALFGEFCTGRVARALGSISHVCCFTERAGCVLRRVAARFFVWANMGLHSFGPEKGGTSSEVTSVHVLPRRVALFSQKISKSFSMGTSGCKGRLGKGLGTLRGGNDRESVWAGY